MSERTGIEKELSDLRSEVYEARNLVIKSDNLLRTLHAEIKAVGKTQERFEKRHIFTGVAAYVIFAVLAAGVAFWAAGSSSKAAHERSEALIAESTATAETKEREATEAQEALSARLEAERLAVELHRLITSESEEERMRGLEMMDGAEMSRVPGIVREIVEDRAGELRRIIVRDSWEQGRRAYLAERMEEAAEALSLVERHGRALPADFEPTSRATAAYYLGAAQNRLGNHEHAATALVSYVNNEQAPRNTLAFANLLLGDSLAQLGRVEEARSAFTAGLETEPGGRHAQTIRRRLEGLGAEAGGASEN